MSLAPLVAAMTRSDEDNIIMENRGEELSRVMEEDHRRLLEELRKILLRAEWEDARRTMWRVSVALFLCLVAVMSYFMWRWRKESHHHSRDDAEEALRQHYAAPAAVVRVADENRALCTRPLLNPTTTGNEEDQSSPPGPSPAEINPKYLNGLKNTPPSYEEAIHSK